MRSCGCILSRSLFLTPRKWTHWEGGRTSWSRARGSQGRSAVSYCGKLLQQRTQMQEANQRLHRMPSASGEPSRYHPDNFRILSVFLESDYLNVSLCALVDLRIDSSQLDILIRGHQRTDYEFSDWAYISLTRRDRLLELIHPKRSYHPTTGYRLLYTFLKYFGSPSDGEYQEIDTGL